MIDYTTRLKKYRQNLNPNHALLLSNPEKIFYLTDFNSLLPAEREAYVLLTNTNLILFHNSFTPLPTKTNHLKLIKGHQLSVITNFIKNKLDKTIKILLYNNHSLTVAEYEYLKKHISQNLIPINQQIFVNINLHKDKTEIPVINQACNIAKTAFINTKNQLQPGITEQNFKQILESEMINLGASQPAFPTIIAFGKHSASPHHQPTNIKLTNNMAVLIDFGAKFKRYCSDMTRSFWFGNKIPKKYQAIKTIVKQAYNLGLNQLRKSISENKTITAKKLDQIVRTHITNQGFSKFFIHTSGHGLGLNIHEQPSISWKNNQKLESDMIITLEPGIYLPNKYGYRYENTLSINKTNVKEITK